MKTRISFSDFEHDVGCQMRVLPSTPLKLLLRHQHFEVEKSYASYSSSLCLRRGDDGRFVQFAVRSESLRQRQELLPELRNRKGTS